MKTAVGDELKKDKAGIAIQLMKEENHENTAEGRRRRKSLLWKGMAWTVHT
jgi:hypothetical protein